MWTALWKLPQAVMWEHDQLHQSVGIYVRRLVEAEKPGSKVTLSTLVRQYADGLGLTAPGMRANRWRIEDPASSRGSGPRGAKSRTGKGSARERFKVIDGDGQAS